MTFAAMLSGDPELNAYMKNRSAHRDNHPELKTHLKKEYYVRNPEKYALHNARHSAKRDRSLGFNPLNSWFTGCEGHHINAQDVIYIPKEMHRSIYHNQFSGQGMAEINALAGAFLTEDWT